MTDKPKSSNPRPIFDVSHPSKTKASATSKPVLVSNRTIIKDPMMSTGSEATTEMSSEPARMLDKVTIQPLSAPALPKATITKAVAVDKDSEEALITEEPEHPNAITEAEEPAQETQPEAETAGSTAASDEEEDAEQQTDTDKEDPKAKDTNAPLDLEKAAKEQAKEEAELQKLIDSKKYFLPIETVENRKAKRFIALGVLLSLLLAAAWFDIALDAGLIHVGNLKAFTHFFSN